MQGGDGGGVDEAPIFFRVAGEYGVSGGENGEQGGGWDQELGNLDDEVRQGQPRDVLGIVDGWLGPVSEGDATPCPRGIEQDNEGWAGGGAKPGAG